MLIGVILWRRYHSRRLLLQRVAELETLSAAGRAIVAAELDVEALCQLIRLESGRIIDNSTFQVGLFDGPLYRILSWTVNGRAQGTPQIFDLSHDGGIIGWVRDSGRPLLVHDFNREMDALPATPSYVSQTPPRSAIFIPLFSGEEVIGIIAAQSDLANDFSEEDLRRLMILANQAAAAIAHAQLFERERRRAAHLELVGQIARQVNAVQDLDEIFDQVVRLTQQTFGFHPVGIFSVDAQTGEAVIQASSVPELAQQKARLPLGQGIVGTAAATRQTIVCNDTTNDERFIAQIGHLQYQQTAARAEIAVPLIVNGDVLGVLDVQSPQARVFRTADKTTLEALAAEVATAIQKAQQLARQREQAWLTAAQLQVAEAIGRSADLDEVVSAVTRLTSMLVGVSFCAILLWDEEMGVYHGASLYGANSDTVDSFTQLQLQIGDWGALDAVHVGQQPLTSERVPPWLKRSAVHTSPPLTKVSLHPIRTKSQLLGVMLVSELESVPETNLRRQGVTGRRHELLHNIIVQAAQAIESAYLRAAQQEEAWVNTALLQVAEAVNSLIDLDEILNTIVRLVPMLVGVESAIILILDEEQQIFHAGPSHGISKMGRGVLETIAIEPSEFPTLMQQPPVSLTPNLHYYRVQIPPWLEKVLGTPAAHAFPLNARGRLVGAMVVGTFSDNGRSFSSRRLNILNGIAHQAATAVVNNQLYKVSAERNRLEQELNVAHEIQASLIPPGNPHVVGCSVASFWQAARQVSGDFYDFLPLSSGHWGVVVADVADKGMPAALFMALSRTILRTVAFSRVDPADTLQRANAIIDKDTQSDLFVTVFYAVWNPETETLTYANAGHNPPMLLHPNGKTRLLKGTGIALGVLPEIEIEQRSIRFHPNDILLIYTDGVTEAMNEDYDEFGLERLHITADKAKRQGASGIVQAVTSAIRDHAGETPQFDDITLVVMKRHGHQT
jgi:serine phosphatase RsbU (regulator of sigma subunit)/putative methionine-R-sulfoxide reductase with GAF domain